MTLSRLVIVLITTFSITASGCADPEQRAREAQQLFLAQLPITLPADSRPNDLAIADINGDGSPDLIVACTGKVGVCVLLGDKRGRFRPVPGSPFPASTAPHLVAVGDLNSDKKLDIVVTSHDSNGVFVLLGDGRGSFALTLSSPHVGFIVGKPHNHGLALGDLNGDGKADITIGHQDLGAIAVLLGDGAGGFTPSARSPFKLGRGFYPHALGDVNGDGKLDIVAPDIMGSAITVAVGDANGTFTSPPNSSLRVKPRPFFILLDDLNGDHHLDIAATHDDIHDIDVFLGDGKGNFSPAHGSPFNSGRQGWLLVAADFDGDGQKDLIVGGLGGFTVFTGDGTGGFTTKAHSSYEVAGGTSGIAAGDFNRDGKLEVVVSDATKGEVLVFLHR